MPLWLLCNSYSVSLTSRPHVHFLVQVGMDIARRKELEFFKGSRPYSDLRNVGMGFLSTKLSSHLIGAIRRQLPVIQQHISEGIIALEKELEALGGPGAASRGSMIHLVLQLCRTFEEAFGKVRFMPCLANKLYRPCFPRKVSITTDRSQLPRDKCQHCKSSEAHMQCCIEFRFCYKGGRAGDRTHEMCHP